MARKKEETKTADGMPHPEVLKTLASQVSGAQADMDSARGEIGSFMKNGEEKHGVHRKAFKLNVSLKKMDSTKLAEFLRHFDHYRKVFELDRLAGTDMLRETMAAEAVKAAGVANGNQADSEPVPASDEQEDDPRPESLKRRHEEIEAEQKATEERVADNVTKLRRVKKLDKEEKPLTERQAAARAKAAAAVETSYRH